MTAQRARAVFAVAAVAAFIAIVGLGFGMTFFSDEWAFIESRSLARSDMTRALVTVAQDPDPPPGAQLERSLVLVPSARSLRDLAAAYGDPRTDALVPWAVRPIPADILTEARRRLIEGAPIPGVSD